MKTLIAIPCWSMVHTAFMNSLIRLKHCGEVGFAIQENSLIYDARDNLCGMAINGGFDYVLFIDSDMVFEPDMLERLIKTAEAEHADITTALFFTRKAPFKPSLFKEFRYERQGEGYIPIAENLFDYPRDSVFEIAGCGMAATLLRTDAVKEVWDREGTPFQPSGGFGEDMAFCIKLKKNPKRKIVCDSRVKVGHIGQFTANEDMYLAQGVNDDGNTD